MCVRKRVAPGKRLTDVAWCPLKWEKKKEKIRVPTSTHTYTNIQGRRELDGMSLKWERNMYQTLLTLAYRGDSSNEKSNRETGTELFSHLYKTVLIFTHTIQGRRQMRKRKRKPGTELYSHRHTGAKGTRWPAHTRCSCISPSSRGAAGWQLAGEAWCTVSKPIYLHKEPTVSKPIYPHSKSLKKHTNPELVSEICGAKQ